MINLDFMKLILTLALMFIAMFGIGQTASLSGKLTGPDRKPVEDGVLQLLKASDSSLVKTEITPAGGGFSFTGIPHGAYLLFASAPGFGRLVTGPLTVSRDTTLAPLTMKGVEQALKEVAVVAKKPFIERDKGKVILDPEASVMLAGASAFDVLEKAPGVRIDNNENISLNGRPGTAIWIDGKPTPMTGSDLSNYLRGMPASAIDKVEFISNPSARYDAAGSAIINIRLKKDKRIGTNANLSVSYGQGVYPKSNNSISFNHRDKKINFFGSYSYARREAFSHLRLLRKFSVRDSFIGAFDQDNYTRFDFNTNVARTGLDYTINRKNTIGFVLSGVHNSWDPTTNNTSDVYDSQYQYASLFRTSSNNSNRLANVSGNVNFRHDFDSAGTSLVTDLDVAAYSNQSRQNIETRYFDPLYNEMRNPYVLHGDLDGSLNIYAIKNDFSKTFAKGLRLETGNKSSYVVADNALAFYDRSGGLNIYDSTKSNHFIYTENINAAYLTASKDFQKWSFQLGLRAENTNITGEQEVYNANFRRSYTQLFPSALVSYKLNKKNTLEFNYSRRIRRPGYEQLNPFKFYLDPTTYREGNPLLQPSTTESFELNHIFRDRIYTTLGFGRTFNNIIQVIAPVENQQQVTVQTNRNLSMVDVYTFNSAIPVEVTDWWTTSTDFNIYYAFYTGNVAATQLNASGGLNASFNSQNTFSLPKDFSIELSGNYQAKEKYAFDVIDPIWSVNAGIQKKVFSNRGTLRLSVNDIFYSFRIKADVKYTDYDETFIVQRDSRVVTLAFSYRFGKNSVPGAKRRNGAADDLKQRASEGTG
jgi:hypothetical protein